MLRKSEHVDQVSATSGGSQNQQDQPKQDLWLHLELEPRPDLGAIDDKPGSSFGEGS